MSARQLARCAERVLAGVGDPRLGEWREDRIAEGGAYHLRRRLHASEQLSIGDVADIRHTPEAATRAAELGSLLALAPPEVLAEEVGS